MYSPSVCVALCSRLDWGTIGVNIWAVFNAANPFGVWGAPPNRHNDLDIQSGKGLMGNALLLENVRKTVVRGQWCDPMITAAFVPTAKSPAIARAFSDLQARQTVLALLALVWAMLVGRF